MVARVIIDIIVEGFEKGEDPIRGLEYKGRPISREDALEALSDEDREEVLRRLAA